MHLRRLKPYFIYFIAEMAFKRRWRLLPDNDFVCISVVRETTSVRTAIIRSEHTTGSRRSVPGNAKRMTGTSRHTLASPTKCAVTGRRWVCAFHRVIPYTNDTNLRSGKSLRASRNNVMELYVFSEWPSYIGFQAHNSTTAIISCCYTLFHLTGSPMYN